MGVVDLEHRFVARAAAVQNQRLARQGERFSRLWRRRGVRTHGAGQQGHQGQGGQENAETVHGMQHTNPLKTNKNARSFEGLILKALLFPDKR